MSKSANTKDEQDRTARKHESRDNDMRPTSWSPPTVLPEPEPQEGWVFRWVRTSMIGHSDNRNVSMRLREGWEPVRAEDHPELMLNSDHNSEWGERGCVEVGGLLLCKAPKELMDQRRQHYERMADSQMEAIDNNLMRENDPRMPILAPDRNTRVSFGGG